MRTKPLQEALPFVAVIAAGVAIFFFVRLLLPTGEDALPPFPALAAEPPPPVFSVAEPGATLFVAGSAVFGDPEPGRAFQRIAAAAERG